MNRLSLTLLSLFLVFTSSSAFALCSTNICSAELPNDTDNYLTVGRVSVLLQGSTHWTQAYSKDLKDPNPWEGPCECREAQNQEAAAGLDNELSTLRLTYDHYNVECFAVPSSGGARSWILSGRFNVGDTERSYYEWGAFFCGNNSFRYKSATDLVDFRFETAAALLNDEDGDGLGTGDDHCDNSLAAGPNFGWDSHHSGVLLLGDDAGEQRGCFARKEWPAPETRGLAIQKSCTVTVSAKVPGKTGANEIFRMNGSGPALVMGAGEDIKTAAQTIYDVQYRSQGTVYAHCLDATISTGFVTKPYGRSYAEWQAAGLCGGAMETASLEFIPLTQNESFAVSCVIDNDADGDGVANAIDMCPMTPAGTAVFPETFSDQSQRGCPVSCGAGNEYIGESCVQSCPASASRIGVTTQCQCSDGTSFDPNVGNICDDRDEDKDGVPWPLDLCPHSAFPSIVDANGCELDTDKDGVPDRLDHCPLTPAGTSVDSIGCGLDSDGDGIEDSLEYSDGTIDCRGTSLKNADGSVNQDLNKQVIRSRSLYKGKYLGCLIRDVDADNDGVLNSQDLCPATPAFEAASLSCETGSKVCGCSESDLDSDGDGIRNADDLCPTSPGTVANKGCSLDDMNAVPASNVCPVQSLDQLTQDFYKQIVLKGQTTPCSAPLNVIDQTGRSYGSVCKGTEGYSSFMLEKNISTAVVANPELNARAECYVRSHAGASIRAEYISPLYQDHQVRIWKNRELLQLLSGSQNYACKALLNDYNVHVSSYHGLMASPKQTLGGHDRNESVEIFGAGGLDVSAEAACAIARPSPDSDPSHFLKLYP
ncbi:MAG: thrombospondin type 3 repeat-containing protein [Chitinophagaceae bacterium]|nr:thrombospondin type 3 repeat-containing protein [Oligoflexus sp.]